MKKYRSFSPLILLLLFSITSLDSHASKEDQFKYLGVRGSSETYLDILQLQEFGNAMFIGAHPDDENNALLTYLNKGLHLKTSYLVSNWGEGGQNEIGDELYDALGVIRAQELESARVIDGAKQLFLGATDFGYSVSTEETFRYWDKEELLGNMVRHIRTEKPDVIFSHHRSGKGDHGQHMATGVLMEEAFDAAADPNQYPEQIHEEGLQPWQVKKLYQAVNDNDIANGFPNDLELDLGEYSSVMGMSFSELGALSRSMHICQGMVRSPQKGASISRWMLSKTAVGAANSGVMDGIDSSYQRIHELFKRDSNYKRRIRKEIDSLDKSVAKIIKGYDIKDDLAVRKELIKAIKSARTLIEYADTSDVSEINQSELQHYLQRKETDLQKVIERVLGVAVDIVVSDKTVIPGQEFTAKATFYNRGQATLDRVWFNIELPEEWELKGNPNRTVRLSPGESSTVEYTVVAADTGFTNAYDPSPLNISGSYIFDKNELSVGSFDELKLVPALAVSIAPERAMLIAEDAYQISEFSVLIRNNNKDQTRGYIQLDLPAGWSLLTTDTRFEINRKGEETSVNIQVKVPANASGQFEINASAISSEQEYSEGYQIIAYPHIYTKHLYTEPEHQLTVVDVAVPEAVKVGYIDSGYDRMYDALRQMGFDVTLLSPEDLAMGDLGTYDSIIVGVRGYLSRPDLVTANGRLLNYVENGGNLVVQFQKTAEWRPEFAPYPIELSNININDQFSEVTILSPENPVFNFPNIINDADWDDWFQQRAEWTPKTWDEDNYVELISAADPGQEDEPRTGAWLFAEYGKGTYMYTSVVWHLQLDNLVPGGYRMMANILGLSEVPN